MIFYGLLSARIPVEDINLQAKWLKSFLNYNVNIGSFFFNDLNIKEKITGYISPEGGLPMLLAQSFNGNASYDRVHPQIIRDLGILAFKMRVSEFERFYMEYKISHRDFVKNKIFRHAYYDRSVWITDTSNNLFQVVQWTKDDGVENPQFFGAIINVKDIEKVRRLFFSLGFDQIVYEGFGFFEDLVPLGFPSSLEAKRVILRSTKPHPFSKFFSVTEIDLIEVPNKLSDVFNKYSLYFFAREFYKKTDLFYPQIKVYDNDMVTAMVADIDSFSYLNLKAVELRRLKLGNALMLNLEDDTAISPSKLKFLFKNMTEKN